MSAGQPRLVATVGAINGVNRDYAVPSPYISGTVRVFHNGVLLDPDGDHPGPDGDGWVEINAPTNLVIRLNFAPRDGDTVFIYYEDRDNLAGGGLSGGVPQMVSAQDLVPIIQRAINLRPDILASSVEGDLIPVLYSKELRPEMKSATDLRPVMLSAEETP